MNVVDVLRLGQDRIFKEDNWCQYTGYDSQGRYCAVGAIGAAVRYCHHDIVRKAVYELDITAMSYGFSGIVKLNDKTTHAFVMRIFDETITRLTLPGKSKRITVEPVEQPKETPAPEPVPEPVRIPEPVPA